MQKNTLLKLLSMGLFLFSLEASADFQHQGKTLNLEKEIDIKTFWSMDPSAEVAEMIILKESNHKGTVDPVKNGHAIDHGIILEDNTLSLYRQEDDGQYHHYVSTPTVALKEVHAADPQLIPAHLDFLYAADATLFN